MRRIRVANEFFIDSNVFLYAVSPHTAKAERAIELLRMKPTISVQVLNEFVNVSRKKLKLDWLDVEKGLAAAKSLCSVVAIDLETQMRSVELSQANRIGIYDANIIAAAELAGCDVLYTEDMSHGQRIGRVTIQNPFVAA
jgi:predicted nucleic acid-binding protein